MEVLDNIFITEIFCPLKKVEFTLGSVCLKLYSLYGIRKDPELPGKDEKGKTNMEASCCLMSCYITNL